MGYMRHHAIIVTSWNEGLSRVHAKAVEIFDDMVTPITKSWTNGYASFMVVPDGSKEGWPESRNGDARRDQFLQWLNAQRYEDRSTSYDWAEVQYGDDNGETRICRHSDEPPSINAVDPHAADPGTLTTREKELSMSDPVSAPSSSPLHALIEKWRKQVKHSAYYIRFYKDQQDLEGTETPLVLASEALAFADELEATLTAAPQTPEQELETLLRHEWWFNHACERPNLYGDDGEMQCNTRHDVEGCMSFLDFKRTPFDELHRIVDALRMRRAVKAFESSREARPLPSSPEKIDE